MAPIRIQIDGPPVAKGRGRATVVTRKRDGKMIARIYTPEKTRSWEDLAAAEARIVMAGRSPLEGGLGVTVIATFAPPDWAGWKRRAALSGELQHTTRPDGDNVLKAAKDALNRIVWQDDAQITRASVFKRYGLRPGVLIEVEQTGAMCSQTKRQAAA